LEVRPGEVLELLLAPKTPDVQGRYYPHPPSAGFAIEGRRDAEAVFRAELVTG
jgi:hypothetical protein